MRATSIIVFVAVLVVILVITADRHHADHADPSEAAANAEAEITALRDLLGTVHADLRRIDTNMPPEVVADGVLHAKKRIEVGLRRITDR